jgi:hypothetical protein
MPSIKVTPTKGLFQRSATTAIPNGTLSGHKRVVTAKTASYTMTQADCGTVITITGARTLTLPALATSAGFHCSAVMISAANGVVTGPSGKIQAFSVNATASEYDPGVTTLTLSAGAIGDRFEIYCTGDWWVVTAFANAAVVAT